MKFKQVLMLMATLSTVTASKLGVNRNRISDTSPSKYRKNKHDLVPDTDNAVFRRDNYAYELSIEEAKESLKLFFRELRSFVTGTDFLYLEFEDRIVELRSRLSALEYSIEIEYYYEELASGLLSARNMYQAMVDATDRMKKYTTNLLPGHDLVYQMIELHVRFLCLLYSTDEMAHHKDLFEKKILSLFRSFRFVSDEMSHLSEVPVGMKSVFDFYNAKTKDTIEDLVSEIQLKKKNGL